VLELAGLALAVVAPPGGDLGVAAAEDQPAPRVIGRRGGRELQVLDAERERLAGAQLGVVEAAEEGDQAAAGHGVADDPVLGPVAPGQGLSSSWPIAATPTSRARAWVGLTTAWGVEGLGDLGGLPADPGQRACLEELLLDGVLEHSRLDSSTAR
jgi:hypothetical protein